MTIQITRGSNTFEYRQREQNPCELEWRPTYRGARWQFIARFDTPDEARQALLAIEAKWRGSPVGAAAGEEEGNAP